MLIETTYEYPEVIKKAKELSAFVHESIWRADDGDSYLVFIPAYSNLKRLMSTSIYFTVYCLV
jgi:hypothetical protein